MRFEAYVRDVMNTDVKTVDVTDSVQKAAQLMAQFRIGSVVVVGDKRIKGIVTAEDIVYKYVAQRRGERVSDIMTRDPITITPEKTLKEASELMAKNKIKKLPVQEAGRLVGIITASDIVKVEPALSEILKEQLKILRPGAPPEAVGAQMFQCEVCGNYSDEVQEIDGVWICPGCEEMRAKR
ncbi:MAG: CBS domain-containing protein [Candidatus Aenigmatarchaeota archaeon]